jgi:hypothetical protein
MLPKTPKLLEDIRDMANLREGKRFITVLGLAGLAAFGFRGRCVAERR